MLVVYNFILNVGMTGLRTLVCASEEREYSLKDELEHIIKETT